VDGPSSVSEVYLKRDTAEASHSPGSESCAGRLDMTFLDFWSTSSDLYEPDEGSKDAEESSTCFEPSSVHRDH
jgi:hypothetical protein